MNTSKNKKTRDEIISHYIQTLKVKGDIGAKEAESLGLITRKEVKTYLPVLLELIKKSKDIRGVFTQL